VARRERTPARRRRLLFWLGAAVVCAIGVAYVQPVRAYFDTQADVAKARAERTALLRKQGELRHRMTLAGTDAFMEREARKLGLVVPGEELYIVNGLTKP
jgi:cell division protein FtsB